jgi:hypothetical protein
MTGAGVLVAAMPFQCLKCHLGVALCTRYLFIHLEPSAFRIRQSIHCRFNGFPDAAFRVRPEGSELVTLKHHGETGKCTVLPRPRFFSIRNPNYTHSIARPNRSTPRKMIRTYARSMGVRCHGSWIPFPTLKTRQKMHTNSADPDNSGIALHLHLALSKS